MLRPANSAFEAIVLVDVEPEALRVFAEVVEVVGGGRWGEGDLARTNTDFHGRTRASGGEQG